MQVKITPEGLFLPKEWFYYGDDEFEIRREGRLILIMPVSSPDETFKRPTVPYNVEDDPIWRIGEDPIEDDEIDDASINHDKYIYGL